MRLSEEEFCELVEEALTDLPEELAEYLQNVVVEVVPEPDASHFAKMDADDPRDLLGLYHGTPLTHRSVEDSMRLPDRVTIFQRNIERMCRSRNQIIRQVRKTVFHEIGHHFGLEEDDLENLGFA